MNGDLLTPEEVDQHKMLIEDCERRIARGAKNQEELRLHIKHMKSQLQLHRETKRRKREDDYEYARAT